MSVNLINNNFKRKGIPLREVPINKKVKTEKPAKVSRSIFSYDENLAPSIAHTTELGETLKEHAHLRVQLFYVTSLALYKKAERTDKKPSDVKVTIPGARIQVGRGNLENHAAHSNASAHVVDNLQEHYIDQIVHDGLSPKKRLLLKAKNMSTTDLDELQKNHTDEVYVKSVIQKQWKHPGILTGTQLEFTLNTTHCLPRGVNLGCDLVLEKAIRPYMEKLYTQVMKGELTPEEATHLYTKKIKQHFKNQILDFENKIDNHQEPNKLSKQKTQLFYHQMELKGSKKINFQALRKGFEKENDIEKPIDVEKTFALFI